MPEATTRSASRSWLVLLLALLPTSPALAQYGASGSSGQSNLALIAPTAPPGDSSYRVANTACVAQAIGGGSLPLASGKIFIGSAGNVATAQTPTGDCAFSILGAVICTKTNNVVFAPSATTDTTNAGNISSGTLASARGGAGAITGALKGSGAGVVSQAACADLSNGGAGCSATLPLPVANGGWGTAGSSWSTYTPTLSCGACSFTSASAAGRFLAVGKTTFLNVAITITANGSCSSFAGFTLPNNVAAATFFGGRSSSGSMVGGQTGGAGSNTLNYSGAAGAYGGSDGATIAFSGVYENQ